MVLATARAGIAMTKYLFAFLLLLLSANATVAAGVDSLIGRWCGESSDYTFHTDGLDVTGHNGGIKTLPIAKIELRKESINIRWTDGTNTVFRLDEDHRTLIQLPNLDNSGEPEGDMGPRREFHRC